MTRKISEQDSKSKLVSLILRSKKMYTWKFELDGTMTTVELTNSHFSGKKAVYKDGMKMIET